METQISSYDQQALDFLQATQTEFKAEFIEHNFYFQDDKEKRDIYRITLIRAKRRFEFKFGQSIAHSGKWIVKDKNPSLTKVFDDKIAAHGWASRIGNHFNVKPNTDQKAPSAYSVLACLTKSDPGSFANFCAEFGYNEDSRKAEKTYKAVRNEWQEVRALFSDSELEQLQEIN